MKRKFQHIIDSEFVKFIQTVTKRIYIKKKEGEREKKNIKAKSLTYVFTCPSKYSFFIGRNSGAVSMTDLYVEERNLLSASNQT